MIGVELTRTNRIALEDHVRNTIVGQPLGKPGGNRVVLRDNDVVAHRRRHEARRAQADAGLEPRRVKQADEEERQHHQQKHNAGQQHDDAEEAADVAGERDVAETQRGHHHERPVETGYPGVRLVLDAQLDHMEEERVDRDESRQEGEVFGERAKIPACFRV